MAKMKPLIIKHRGKKIKIGIKLKLPFQTLFSLIIKHRGEKNRHKIKIAISNPFFPDLGYLPYSSLAEEDTHKNMNLINDTRIVFFLKLQKRFIHSFF